MSLGWNIAGKTVLVTGGTSGIGYATAMELADQGATVFITSRSQRSADSAAEALSRTTKVPVRGLELDLSRLGSVRSFADKFAQDSTSLDVLVNNAGTISGRRTLTEDGLELTFAANFLGPFLLTQLLLPKLMSAASARILNVSSELYRNAKKGLDFSNLQLNRGFSPSKAYANSKLAIMLFTSELQDRLAGENVAALALHPGVVRTNFGSGRDSSRSMSLMMKILGPMLKSPEEGAATTIHLATAPLEILQKSWYWSEGKPAEPTALALDPEAGARLWHMSEEFVSSL
jgi:retinol dehydrogenase-14